jgi:hypothetical protein
MESDFDTNHVPNPEESVRRIPFLRAEISEQISREGGEVQAIVDCFNGYNLLNRIAETGLESGELVDQIPQIYRAMNLAFYPQREKEDDFVIPETGHLDDERVHTVKIDDEIELQTIAEQARFFLHGLGNVASAIDSRNQGLLETPINEYLREALIHGQELLRNELYYETLTIGSLATRFFARVQTAVSDRVDYAVHPDLGSKIIEVPQSWLMVLARDIGQNIARKKERDGGIINPVIFLMHDEELDRLRIRVEDDGTPYPDEIVKNGFQKDVGNNPGGKHIAMAAHAEIAKRIGARLYAVNDEEDGLVFPQTHILLPYRKMQ